MHPLVALDRHPVIAHRGASARAPENTLEAVAAALDDGADALEMDVHVTADDVAVVIHDPTLDRTTDASGPVATLPLARVQEADAGARFTRDGRTFPFRGRGVRVPTLEQVLERFPSAPLLLEIKTRAAQSAIARVLERHRAAERSLLMSFDVRALERFRRPPWLTGAATREARQLLLCAMHLRPLRPVPYRVVSVPERWRGVPVPIGPLAHAARRLGCPVHVWVVDAPARALSLWRLGVAGITTNVPAVMRALRDDTFPADPARGADT